MRDYSRKPYISKTYKDLMRRAPWSAMQEQELRKQSEFEKPYKDQTYNEMQHYDPGFPGISFDSPNWDFPWNTGDPVPEIESGPGSFTRECCSLTDNASEYNVQKGQQYKVYMHKNCWSFDIRNVRLIDDPVVNWDVTDNLTVVSQSNAECIVEVNTDVYGDCDVTATTRSGLTCSNRHQVGECTCGTMAIGYTTLQMGVDEGQNLTVDGSPEGTGCIYTWVIASGGGTIVPETGNSVTYTAPSSNANCTNNPTIQLYVSVPVGSSYLCDSITIAVNASSGVAVGNRYFDSYCHYLGGGVCDCVDKHDTVNCDGTITHQADPVCRTIMSCGLGCFPLGGPDRCLNSSYCRSNQSPEYENWRDGRTSEQIAAGCCPAELM